MTLHDITCITCHYMQNKMLMTQVSSFHLEFWPPGQDWANLYIRIWTWYRHVCTCSHMFMKAQTCTYMSLPWTWISWYLNHHDDVCRLYIHVHVIIHLYVHGTHTFMNVNLCMDILVIQTRLYKFTTTLHFPSCLIRETRKPVVTTG